MEPDLSLMEYMIILQSGQRPTRQQVQALRHNMTQQNDISSEISSKQQSNTSHKKEQKEKKIQKKKINNQCKWCKKTTIDQMLCDECKVKYDQNDYCPICKQGWKKNQNDKSIQCDDCKMWIHKNCDEIFIHDPHRFKQYRQNSELTYRCSNCRRLLKVQILQELIRYLTYFDGEKLLWQLDPNSVKYFEVIKNPIDFDTIHKHNKAGKYVKNSDSLYQDIKLLLSNFLEFNLPNPKIHRKGCILKLLYDILFTHFRKYLKMSDNDLLTATNDFHLNTCEFIQQAFKTFLNQAFGGSDLIKIEGISNFIPLWEPQLLSISPTVELRSVTSNLLIWEKNINPALEFENENEPLVKLNMVDFLTQQVQQDIKIRVDINLLTHRHPYLDYLLKLESPYLSDDSNNSPQLQYSIKEMLTKDLSTINIQQPITIKVLQPQLMVEYLCCSCGGYEHLNNLLMCKQCKKTYHFYCQINNSQYHQQRVLASLQNWVCNNCAKCKTCNNYGSKNDLFCCNCNSFYHFQCVFHNFIAPTDGLDFWKCPDCFKCINCSSTQLFDTNKLSKIKPSTTSHTLHISIEYFQNFQYCLQCGLDAAGYRFCEYCEEYIPINIEEMNKIQIEIDYSSYGSLYQAYFEEVKYINQQKIYLTKEPKQNKSSKQCVKCKQFYHVSCLTRNKKTINEQGICSDCSQDMSTLLFKIEKLKEQNIRQSIQAKSLKKVVPVVSNFLEWGPQLTQPQQTFILENLEILESLVSNFLNYQHNIDNLKEELTNNKDTNDEYIDKLTQYWCARFDWMEQPKQCFTMKQQIRQDFISNALENDYYDRLLSIEFFKQKKHYSIYSLQTFVGIRNNIFQSQFALDTLCLITDLQCCYVENLKYGYQFVHLDLSYYMNFLSILGFYERFPYLHMQLVDHKRQQLIFLPIPNSIVRSIKKCLGLQIIALKQQSAKESILIQKGWAKIASNSLKHNLKHLGDRFSDTQITEKLKSYQHNQKQIRQCIKDIKLLKEHKFCEVEQKIIQQDVIVPEQPKEIQTVVYEEQIIKYPQNQSDDLIESPLDNLLCQLCKKQGNRTVSGRLLYVDETRWVHTNCVIWNEDCRESELCVKALLKNNNFKCEYCATNGSSIICCKCRKKAHFYCAYQQQWSFTQTKKVFCQVCYDYQEHCVTNFMNWRRIVVQQKQDKKSQQAVYRFGNTILIAIKPSEQKGQFEELNLLTLRDKMLYISLNMKEFSIKYSEVNKAVFLQECEKCEKNIQIFLQVAKLLMDKYCQCVKEYKVYNLEQLLQSFKDFNITGMEFNENLGQFFMLYTPQIRQQLLDSKNMQKIINSVQFTSFRQWFYQGIIVEDLPLDERIHQIQQLSRVISDSQIDYTKIYINHPMLYDNLPVLETKQSNNFQRKDPQSKLINVYPNDILEEAGLSTEDSKQSDKQDELEKKLRHDSKNQKQRNKLYVAPSFIHKYGLFTKQEFKKGDFVIEYTGEIISNALADFREVTYNEQGFGDCYMFRASKTHVIDATFKGSEARFLNHSCQPNCASLLLDEKILIYAKKDILIGEELTYDYQFEIEAESQKIQCRCGAKNCVGRLN